MAPPVTSDNLDYPTQVHIMGPGSAGVYIRESPGKDPSMEYDITWNAAYIHWVFACVSQRKSFAEEPTWGRFSWWRCACGHVCLRFGHRTQGTLLGCVAGSCFGPWSTPVGGPGGGDCWRRQILVSTIWYTYLIFPWYLFKRWIQGVYFPLSYPYIFVRWAQHTIVGVKCRCSCHSKPVRLYGNSILFIIWNFYSKGICGELSYMTWGAGKGMTHLAQGCLAGKH